MKVTLIFPRFPFVGRVPMVPPILEYLGALTRQVLPDVELELIDANVEEPTPEEINADLVGISSMTTTVSWAYDFADRLMKKGVPVVLEGIHPSAMPEEAINHADAVVVGEAESVWAQVLNDACRKNLKKFYRGERNGLDNIPLPLAGAVKGPYKFRAVFTARGCPYKCSFCSVRKFFGDTIRYRPIPEVVKEVETCCDRMYFNGDDNIWGTNVERNVELFTELANGSKKHWYGFGDLTTVQGRLGDTVLKAAKESGLFSVWVGWESSSAKSLHGYNATAKQGRDCEDAVRKIKDHGIDVVAFVILGGRDDTMKDFDRAIDLADKLGVSVHPALLTPLPGTELYEQYKPYLVKERGWEYYTGANALFDHPDPLMTVLEREKKYYETSLQLLSPGRIVKHLFDISLKGFPTAHISSVIKQLKVRRRSTGLTISGVQILLDKKK